MGRCTAAAVFRLMNAYESFSSLYEQFMEDAPYDEWIHWLKQSFPDLKNWSVADVGCGTGTLTRLLAQSCRRVVGIDLSADMLGIAMSEAASARLRVEWLCQDMTQLVLPWPCELIVSTCDAINYLKTWDEVTELFRRVRDQLVPGGWFCFDVIGQGRLHQLCNGLSYDIREDAAAIFETTVTDTGPITYELNAFRKTENGLYTRVSEEHRQQWYPIEQIEQALVDNGFEIHQMIGDFSAPVTTEALRVVIQAQVER